MLSWLLLFGDGSFCFLVVDVVLDWCRSLLVFLLLALLGETDRLARRAAERVTGMVVYGMNNGDNDVDGKSPFDSEIVSIMVRFQ